MPTLSEEKRWRNLPPPEPKWWLKSPARAGEACTPAQRRLADDVQGSYTGIYRRRFEAGGLAAKRDSKGDYCDRPIEASNVLQSRGYRELTIPLAAADFRTETEWRLRLRPLSPSAPQVPKLWQRRADQRGTSRSGSLPSLLNNAGYHTMC
eukprot:gnl/TRDRNA2_/TRDRNA2_198304_c0_seq1.p1 gnl/TRDRNA2_/TRDRNA2_198304_c0~~gnl/TRDRNA2_/TRDRNA2_198304_c0_seq1.p1  ORF type:complete len:151 (+),score=16.61 gnl/TRDRNA2_/TRDRNA2_198304_c0_seq1:91-543(+)